MSKEDLIARLAEEIKACRGCGLWRSRLNPVVGEGSLNATIMFVGEAPGHSEDVKGLPFVGAAGKFLDELLSGIGLSREEVYVGNVIKCRPPGNRDPRPDEVEACTPFLDEQIRLIRPAILVPLGRHAASYVLSKAGFRVSGITRIHGRVYDTDLFGIRITVIPTYHPAAALYNAKYRDELKRDFEILKRELGRLKPGFRAVTER